MTLTIKDSYEQSRKTNSEARRNPNSRAGTNATVIYMRENIDASKLTAGTGKLLNNVGIGAQVGEEEIHGIEDIIEANPDVTIIDNNTGYTIRIRSDTRLYKPAVLDDEAITRMTEEFVTEHGREPDEKEQAKIERKGTKEPAVYEGDAKHFKVKDTQRLLKQTRGHGYRRFAMKTQRHTQRLNMKTLIVMFIESVASILKPSRHEMGRVLASVYRKSKRMNEKLDSMEKTQGSKYLKQYIEGTKHGRHMVDAMYTKATGKQILMDKVGDSHLAIHIEEIPIGGDE